MVLKDGRGFETEPPPASALCQPSSPAFGRRRLPEKGESPGIFSRIEMIVTTTKTLDF